jgi:putative DNA-invertase from lambdoid prophage Rac
MKNKWAVYLRVSTQEQTNQNQILKLTEYCEKQGYNYHIFEEVESSRKSRPVKQQLLNRLRKKEFEGVIVYKLDRWARSSRELILELEELTDKSVQFISYSENIDFGSPSGRLHFQILSAFAEFERELLRERTLDGLNRAKSEGKQLGRPQGSKDQKERRKSGYHLRYSLSK